MVLEACPDVNEYKFTGGKVRTWPEFLETVRAIRPMLGISPSAWEEAIQILGVVEAHVVLATILQRSEHSSEARLTPAEADGAPVSTVNGSPAIRSAGGYLRALTEKARAGEFALGPVLMALIGQRLKAKRSGAAP
jgi:replication initiation protein RepC